MSFAEMKKIEVVAAIIHDAEGRIFATQRGYGDYKDGWEFPGGKIEPGETAEEALKREIIEELDTRIAVERLVETVEWDYPKFGLRPSSDATRQNSSELDSALAASSFHLTMHCYWCHVESGHLELREHEAARWLSREELESVDWLPADWEVVRRLANPAL